ncbi:hypothetical protein L3Q82_014047, partial [Scortum barcoo]
MLKTEKGAADRSRPPPVKVLSAQLRAAESSGDGFVVRPGRGRSLPASLVWMQGTVLEVQLDRNTALLMDETGTFAVQGVNNIPKGRPCLCQGEQICHGDGCHPGRLPGASHPCSEDGRPLRARRAPQADVEAGGGGLAAGAGLNAELPAAGRPAPVILLGSCCAHVILDKWKTTSQDSTGGGGILLQRQAPNWE